MDWLPSLLPFLPALYAETHYTLAGFSLIHRRWPEIVADAPYRVEPGRSIPILLLLRHADRFPVTVESARAFLRHPDGSETAFPLIEEPVTIASRSWHRVFHIRPAEGIFGEGSINVRLDVRRPGDSACRSVVNSNLPGVRPLPLLVRIAEHPLPAMDGCLFADLHHHSEYTDDQVEYGTPLEAVAEMAPAMGVAAAAVTDHSYDLDDVEGEFRVKDPLLTRWNAMRERCAEIGRRTGFLLLPGEELSASNARGRNVHLLLLNNRTFVPGTGDSAERWFRTKSERSVREVLDGKAPDTLAFAAHPEHRFHFLQRFFLSRDSWTGEDYRHPNLTGMEILNGVPDKGYLAGLRAWIRLLLEGRRLYLAAGNDAHGAFNRTFQIGLPWISVMHSRLYLFGRSRTGILAGENPSAENLLEALAAGRCFITTGPAMTLSVTNERGETARLGGSLSGKRFDAAIEAVTTPEFGPLEYVKLWLGDLSGRREVPWIELKPGTSETRIRKTFGMENLKADVYVRGLAVSRDASGRTSFAVTNPIWLNRED
jgi:hypothetical protein